MPKRYSRRRYSSARKRFRRSYRRRRPRIPRIQVGSVAKGKTEIKCIDSAFTEGGSYLYTVDDVGALFPVIPCRDDPANNHQNLINMNQGTGISQRIGNSIALKSIRLRFNIQPYFGGTTPTLYTDLPLVFRILLVYDKQCNGAYVPLSTFFGMQTNLNTEVSDISSRTFGNLLPRAFDRFIILMDKMMILPPNQNTNITGGIYFGSNPMTPFTDKNFVIDEYIKLNKLKTQYVSNNPASPNITSCWTGGLMLYWTCDIGNTNSPFFLTGTTRVRYYDE